MTGAPRAAFARAARSQTGQTALPTLPLPADVGEYVVSSVMRSPRLTRRPVPVPHGSDVPWNRQTLFSGKGAHHGQCPPCQSCQLGGTTGTVDTAGHE